MAQPLKLWKARFTVLTFICEYNDLKKLPEIILSFPPTVYQHI